MLTAVTFEDNGGTKWLMGVLSSVTEKSLCSSGGQATDMFPDAPSINQR